MAAPGLRRLKLSRRTNSLAADDRRARVIDIAVQAPINIGASSHPQQQVPGAMFSIRRQHTIAMQLLNSLSERLTHLRGGTMSSVGARPGAGEIWWLVRPAELESATSCSGGKRSIH